jgi:translation initiation factor 5A
MVEGEKKFVNVGSLKTGNFVLIDGDVCQIKNIEKSKPGKHGSAKARVTAMNIFTGSKKTLLKSTGTEALVPIILKASAQVVAISGDTLQIMDTESYEQFTVPKPTDVTGLEAGVEVEYQRWGDQAKIVRKKS